jgi:hypothetical protein
MESIETKTINTGDKTITAQNNILHRTGSVMFSNIIDEKFKLGLHLARSDEFKKRTDQDRFDLYLNEELEKVENIERNNLYAIWIRYQDYNNQEFFEKPLAQIILKIKDGKFELEFLPSLINQKSIFYLNKSLIGGYNFKLMKRLKHFFEIILQMFDKKDYKKYKNHYIVYGAKNMSDYNLLMSIFEDEKKPKTRIKRFGNEIFYIYIEKDLFSAELFIPQMKKNESEYKDYQNIKDLYLIRFLRNNMETEDYQLILLPFKMIKDKNGNFEKFELLYFKKNYYIGTDNLTNDALAIELKHFRYYLKRILDEFGVTDSEKIKKYYSVNEAIKSLKNIQRNKKDKYHKQNIIMLESFFL